MISEYDRGKQGSPVIELVTAVNIAALTGD